MKKTLSVLLVLAILLTALPLTAFAIPNPFGDAWVKTANGGSVNARRSPSTAENNVIKQLPYGTKVEIIGYEKDASWALCKVGGTQAYILARYLVRQNPGKYTPSKPDPKKDVETGINYSYFKHVDPYTMIVSPSSPTAYVNLRWAPSKSVRSMGKYYSGSEMTVIAEGRNWYQVRDEKTGYTGFMMKQFLKK